METISSTNIPSNRDINNQLDNAEKALEETRYEQKYNLNADGQKIIDKTECLIDHTRAFVNTRNPNDTLKQIVNEGQQFYNEVQTNYSKWGELQRVLEDPQAKIDTSALMKQMESISRTAKLVAIELISSSDFRQTVWDFFSVLYAILIDASHIDRIGKPLSEAFEGLSLDSDRSKEKLKQAGQNVIELGLNYLDTERHVVKLTPEQREVLWNRFRDVLRDLSKRERSQRMLHGIAEVIELLFRPFQDLTDKLQRNSDRIMYDDHIQNMMTLSQQLFESFTRTQLDVLISHFKVMFTSIAEDDILKKQFLDLKDWIFRILENPELLGQDITFKEFNWLVDDLSKTIEAKKELRFNFEIMRDELDKIVWYTEHDPLTVYIQRDIKDLVSMIFLDSKGQVVFKPEMLDQLKLVILSSVVKRLRVPLPEIHATDPNSSFAFKVNGLILGIQDVLPERIVAENRGIAVLNIKDKTIEKDLGKRAKYTEPLVDRAAEAIRVKMENINVHMHDADVWFHKRTFPEAEDRGKADIDISGNGMDLTFLVKTAAGTKNLFSLVEVNCDIHDLKLKLYNTHHDTFYNAFITLFKGTIKRHIEEAIAESMAGVFKNLNVKIEKQVANLRAELPAMIGSIH